MVLDLRTLFRLKPHPGPHALDLFVSHLLFEAGVWESPRTSDGIPHIRVLEQEPERLRICGRIYEIDDQSLHAFWLDLERRPSGSGVRWALYFDVVAGSPRRARDAIDLFDHAGEITWRISLTGEAEVRDGLLVAVAGGPARI